ncbi:hypothetical protein L484_011232 [Morus notabilis]|uniref:Uncharacterized protein n=1 Tax=Morus notabilis TaxID=981085 RepID=W9RX72_9ROSA|nr:hypothetical protein L484_011232 [Morus notabilis]
MAKREFYFMKSSISVLLVLLVLASLLSMTCQRKIAVEAHARLSKDCVPISPACHLEVADHEEPEPLDVKDDADPGSGDDLEHHEAAPGDDNDFYRQYGDVPSPGIGH